MLKRVCRHFIRRLLLLFMMLSLGGCASILARVGEEGTLGAPYSGVSYAVENAEDCTMAALLTFPPAVIVTAPVSLFDILTSVVGDTLFLPLDLLMEDDGWGNDSLCHLDWGN